MIWTCLAAIFMVVRQKLLIEVRMSSADWAQHRVLKERIDKELRRIPKVLPMKARARKLRNRTEACLSANEQRAVIFRSGHGLRCTSHFSEMLVRLPQRGEHPAAGDADEAAGNHVAHEVIIGADKPDGNREHCQ